MHLVTPYCMWQIDYFIYIYIYSYTFKGVRLQFGSLLYFDIKTRKTNCTFNLGKTAYDSEN